MAYHVEVRRSHHHARVFNLSETELRETVLEPWMHGRPLELGDRKWERRESQLRILEGPALTGPELAYGQGWNRAERTAREVTGELLAAAAQMVAVLPCTQAAADEATGMLEALGLRAIDWRAALVIGAASVPDWWLFEAGIALGALGPRAALVQLDGEAPPAPLRELDVLRLDPRAPADLERLRERLRRAGTAVPARPGR